MLVDADYTQACHHLRVSRSTQVADLLGVTSLIKTTKPPSYWLINLNNGRFLTTINVDKSQITSRYQHQM
jgi:hypothetical protein